MFNFTKTTFIPKSLKQQAFIAKVRLATIVALSFLTAFTLTYAGHMAYEYYTQPWYQPLLNIFS